MKKHLTKLFGLYNEAPAARGLIGLGNEFPAQESAGKLFMPFGNYLHDEGLQRFDAEAGRELVNALDALKRKHGPDWPGLPIFIGHPDVPELATKFPDKSAYGWITGLNTAADGVTALVNWNEDGKALVAKKKFAWFSPYFGGVQIDLVNSTNIYRPVELRSMGMTNRPNVYKFRLPNEAGDVTTKKEGSDMNLLKRILALMGLPETTTEDDAVSLVQKLVDAARKIKAEVKARWDAELAANSALPGLPNEAGDDERAVALLEQLSNSRKAALDKIQGLENEKRTTGEQLVTLQGQLDAGKARITELEGQLTALANEKTAERNARIALLLDHAITAGRITPAARKQWETELAADFAGKSVALANEKGALKVTPKTGDLGARSSAAQDGVGKIVGLVNEEMKKLGNKPELYDQAYANVKKAHPALFGIGAAK